MGYVAYVVVKNSQMKEKQMEQNEIAGVGVRQGELTVVYEGYTFVFGSIENLQRALINKSILSMAHMADTVYSKASGQFVKSRYVDLRVLNQYLNITRI